MTAHPRPARPALTDVTLLALIALAVMLPNLVWGPSASHSDTLNHTWTLQFAEALGRGEIYPRWLPGAFEGLGSPTFFFYPPLSFYPSALLDLLGVPTSAAIAFGIALWTLASGLAMWLWLRALGGWALLGAALYMVAPYHLTDAYIRGGLAEHAAFAWLPLLALGIRWLPARRGLALLAAAYAGLIMTHLPVALMATVFLLLPLAVRRVAQDRATLLPGLAGGLLGLGLAAAYLLPALTLQGHVSMNLLWGDYYRPETWFLLNGPELSGFYVTMLLAGLAAVALAAVAALRRGEARFWAALAVVAVAAAFGLIPLIWNIPPLPKVQFPWRLLCLAEFAAVTALAVARPGRALLGLALGALLLANAPVALQSASRLARAAERTDYAEGLARTMPEAPEYLARGIPVTTEDDVTFAADLSAYRDLPAGDTITVTEPGPVTLRRAAFPIWRVVDGDGQEVPTQGPLLTFEAEPGTYRIVRVALWQERAGLLASVAAALILGAVALWRRSPAHRPGSRPT